MQNRDFLSGVSGLKLSGRVSEMSETQFSSYIRDLNSFIDRFPSTEDKLHETVGKKDYVGLRTLMAGACDALTKIYADDIAGEYRTQSAKLSAADHDAAETLVENFIQRVSALSIDIQMAMHRSQSTAAAPRQQWASSRRTILAVDNAVMFLGTLKKQLSSSPYELYCTSSCSEALQMCSEIRPDMILLDVEMPDMDGYELARRIKASGAKAPIIFITANSAREYVDRAIAVGAVGLLVKPLRINQLLEKLKEHL